MFQKFKFLLLFFLLSILSCKKSDNIEFSTVSSTESVETNALTAEGRAVCGSCDVSASISGTTTKSRFTASGLKSFSQFLNIGKSLCSPAVVASGSTFSACLSWSKPLNGKLKFSDYDKLKEIINSPSTEQAHHIIPRQLCDAYGGTLSDIHAVVQKAGLDGFQPNDAYNGISLTTAIHSGSHPKYTEWVRFQLNTYNTNNPNSGFRDANIWIQTKLILALRGHINTAKSLNQKVETYFTTLQQIYIGN